jgi:iron complex outermembrane receptor protein
VDIPGRISPELKTVRVTFRVRNLTNAIYAQWADPGLQDQVLLGAPRASAKW